MLVDALAALRLDRLGIEQPDDAVGIAHRGYFGIGHDDGGIGIAHRQRGAALDPGRTVADDPVEFLPQLVNDFGDAVFGQRVLVAGLRRLLITRYSSSRAARGEMLSIDDVLEILATPLLGIIPESQEVLRASNVGSPVTLSNPLSAPARAYFDAARRLKGEQVSMSVPSENRGIFNRLFARKAA